MSAIQTEHRITDGTIANNTGVCLIDIVYQGRSQEFVTGGLKPITPFPPLGHGVGVRR